MGLEEPNEEPAISPDGELKNRFLFTLTLSRKTKQPLALISLASLASLAGAVMKVRSPRGRLHAAGSLRGPGS